MLKKLNSMVFCLTLITSINVLNTFAMEAIGEQEFEPQDIPSIINYFLETEKKLFFEIGSILDSVVLPQETKCFIEALGQTSGDLVSRLMEIYRIDDEARKKLPQELRENLNLQIKEIEELAQLPTLFTELTPEDFKSAIPRLQLHATNIITIMFNFFHAFYPDIVFGTVEEFLNPTNNTHNETTQ